MSIRVAISREMEKRAVEKKQTHTKRATSYDVARLAGVSQTTVSFVINGMSAGISEETQARVRDAIAKLNFHPHAAARNLARRASHTLGFVIPEAGNPHYYEMIQGAKAYAQQHGYSLSVRITDFQVEEEREALRMLTHQLVDALIFVIWSEKALHSEIHELLQQNYPIINISFYDELDTVLMEQGSGERQVIEHLAGLGHRRIGYIYGVANPQMSTRLDTCLKTQQEIGIPVDERWISRCGPTLEDGYRACQELLARCVGDERPTALVVVNDLLTHSVYRALQVAHIVIPQDISVISFDNTPISAYMTPPLTTVDGEFRRQGELAASLAIERIADPKRPFQHLETRVQLIVRASTGPAPV